MPLQRNLEMAQPIDEVILFRYLIFFPCCFWLLGIESYNAAQGDLEIAK